jgi:hypothetical protein
MNISTLGITYWVVLFEGPMHVEMDVMHINIM